MAKLSKARKHDSKELSDHIVGETKFVELNATDAPVDSVQYDVKKGEVHSDPIQDSGTGGKAILRRFQFQLPPSKEGEPLPDPQELIATQLKHVLIPMLYKDELEMIMEPRIVMGKNGKYDIFAFCHPRYHMGVKSVIHEKPQLVQDIINPK